ncbi:RdgB/HAM1 family non-canonical purine NTP pyrophosphatase [Patescibacteria group bacterium]|nr:RdgB/HAM1 family non-canonical purine NTP pyrophosphatase [Patescibacteria group bacterium]
MKLIFSTKNEGKIKEVMPLLADLKLEILSAQEAGYDKPIIEEGSSFEENAYQKAMPVAQELGELTFAEDAGFCIESLNGAPGIYSARWAGVDATDEEIVKHTLSQVGDMSLETKRAWFECAVCLTSEDGEYWTFTGKVNGIVAKKPRGQNRPGLPYDVIFIPEGFSKTYAEMTDEEKNKISHRKIAYDKLKKFLKKNL